MAPAKFRQGVPDDAPSICNTHRLAILELGITAYTQAECESWAADLTPARYVQAMREGEHYLVAEDPLGLCGFCAFKDDEVIGLYVHPRTSRKGIGSRLLARAEGLISASGHETFRVGAALSARDFYLAQGYDILRAKLWKTRGGLEITALDLSKRLG